MKSHQYNTLLTWRGNLGEGTKSYSSYSRDYSISINNKPEISGSSDPAFRGDANKHNPEELFLASISSCHMLWYLHLCSQARITVTDYSDIATGTMQENNDGSGHFSEVMLKPTVTIKEKDKRDLAITLHQEAHKYCFIANSCNFPIRNTPNIIVED